MESIAQLLSFGNIIFILWSFNGLRKLKYFIIDKCMTKCYANPSIIPYETYRVLSVLSIRQKRESGENPERSGHCDRGAASHYPIVRSCIYYSAVF